MCAVSMVHDYGRQQWPTPQDWTRPNYEEWLKLVRQAEEFDRKTKQPDCVDPAKEDFMRQVLERLEAIEKKLATVQYAPNENVGSACAVAPR